MPLRLPAALLGRNCWGAALLLLAVAASPAWPAEFSDAAGRHVVLPDHIGRILPAERNAEVMVFVLAPDKLAAQSRGLRRGGVAVLGWRPRANPAGMAETARRLRADLIIDAGSVTPERAAFADQVTRETGIPYILLDDSFARVPRTLRSIGAILGVDPRHTRDLFLYAEHAIAGLRGRLLIRPADTRPHVYYARGADGLVTALPGSPAGEVIDEAGAINVASPLGRDTEVAVRREQLLAWDPEIIIAQQRGFYEALRRNPGWRRLSAVRHNRVYLEPGSPFGWIDDPSGVNRLIGLYWLSGLLYPDALQQDLRATTCEFYDKFYRIKLTNRQMEAMLRPAGVPPVEVPRPVGEPLVGLGAAPPSMPSSGTLAEPSAMPNAGPAATCTLPGTSPVGLLESTEGPGMPTPLDISPPSIAPGVPPPGRRGRPPLR